MKKVRNSPSAPPLPHSLMLTQLLCIRSNAVLPIEERTVFIPWGCYNKSLQTQWPKAAEACPLTVLEVRRLEPVLAGPCPLGILCGGSVLCLSDSSTVRTHVAPSLISASVATWPPPSPVFFAVCLELPRLFLYKDTSLDLGPTWIIQDYHLKIFK